MSEPTSSQAPEWHAFPISEHVRSVELLISNLLRIGVLLSVLLIVIGTAVFFCQHPAYLNSAEELRVLTHPNGNLLHTMRAVFAGIRIFHGEAIIALGLLLLIVTPMMRVAVSIIAFIKERDGLYALITLAVFCLLMLSLLIGRVVG
jgi:uncharacterized membrane protein